MGLPLYLAATAEEFADCVSKCKMCAWMACHFSAYGTGLANLPPPLPRDAMMILNDRIPICGHDPDTILSQLRQLPCSAVLLDFQRQGSSETAALTEHLVGRLDVPVGVSLPYASGLSCPVFLPPVPPDTSPEAYLSPWAQREIWLEAALDSMVYTVTRQGSHAAHLPHPPDQGCRDDSLLCHYRIAVSGDRADFSLWRTREDLEELLKKVYALGVTRAVGLWQELGGKL